jgi:lipoate-protein ligase A
MLQNYTYSVAVKRKDLRTNDIAEAYNYICNGLIEAAHMLGVNAGYSEGKVKQCPNVIFNGRKISGSAQAHKRGVILQHGTFLMDVNLEKMFTFLKVPWKNACIDLESIASRKITSVADEVGNIVSLDRVYETFTKGFERALDIKLVEGTLTDCELGLARRLEEEKFATRGWNLEGKTSSLLSLKPVG